MNNMNKVTWMSRITSLGLILAFLITSSMVVLAAPGNKALSGEIVVSGGTDSVVMLNGERAYSGRTFFSTGTITTTETSSAVINLGKLGSVNLSPNTVLNLSFTENSISGNLSAGQITVVNNEGVAVNIKTLKGVAKNEANGAGSLTVTADSEEANAQQTQTPSNNKNRVWVPLLVFAGIVGTVAAFTLFNNDNGKLPASVSPVR